ncbi:MAG TPA: hypothetical protein VKD23_16945 [Terriglobales bacterium]|nr:hypothetical protein [Terriglobales bacterium]
MTRPIAFLLVLGLTATAGSAQAPTSAPLKIFLNEVQPGVMSAPQYCTLVFANRRFHSEKADIKQGSDTGRKIYEGQLSDNDWNALVAVIDSPVFRDLKVPQTVPPLVMQDTHPYTLSIARDKDFQNMEFMDNKSLKPYESQVKPLLQWWKAFRGQRTPQSSASADPRCALDKSHAIFSQ